MVILSAVQQFSEQQKVLLCPVIQEAGCWHSGPQFCYPLVIVICTSLVEDRSGEGTLLRMLNA